MTLKQTYKKCHLRESPRPILVPLLFLLYVNDLHNSSAFDPIIFANNTNLFYEHKGLKTFFLSLIIQKVPKINKPFEANKLSHKIAKTK